MEGRGKAETEALAGRKSCRESGKRQAGQRERRKAKKSERPRARREALSHESDEASGAGM